MKTPLTGLIFCLALIGQGCASLYDSEKPDTDYARRAQAAPATISQWQHATDTGTQVTAITELVDLEKIDDLVDEALRNNPGLQQTLIALKASRVQQTSAASAGRPQVTTSFNANKGENSTNTTVVDSSDTTSTTLTGSQYSASLDVSWEIDIWQRIEDSIDAAKWETQASGADYQAARNTLTASLIQAYLDVLTQQQLIDIEQQRLSVLENSESVILTRYRSGLGSLDDLNTAQASSASTRATIAQYYNTLNAARRSLAVLLGRTSLTTDDIDASSAFPEVVQPLARLPEQDLAQRPDLQAAYARINVSDANLSVAYKSLLPSLDISASLTDNGSTPALALFKDPVWTLLGAITAPLYQGGALRANIKTAELETLNSWYQYQATLLTAVQEVEDTLDLETSFQIRQKHIQQALNNAMQSEQTFRSQYRQGLVDILDLLSATQTTYDLKVQLIQLQQSQLSNRIDLGLALGLGATS